MSLTKTMTLQILESENVFQVQIPVTCDGKHQ